MKNSLRLKPQNNKNNEPWQILLDLTEKNGFYKWFMGIKMFENVSPAL